MTYTIAASPKLNDVNHAFWENGFSDTEIADIIAIGENLPIDKGTTSGNETSLTQNLSIRNSYVSWIPSTPDNVWIYDKAAFILRVINANYFNYDITGIYEDLQYTKYLGSQNQHYEWHIDKHFHSEYPQRKLSFVLQLSDPEEYEGGDLEILDGPEKIVFRKEKGLAYVFPSWLLHRVTPITKGIRRSLVIWSAGPAFK